MKVVVIDDERIVLRGIAATIQKMEGFFLAGTAENGMEGIELILREKPDIVLTDIRMPGQSGLDMIRKAKEHLPDTIYIVFSGFTEYKYAKEAIGLGCIDYLEKPVTKKSLAEVLDRASGLIRHHEDFAAMQKTIAQSDRATLEKTLRDLYDNPSLEERYLQELMDKRPALRQIHSLQVLKISALASPSPEEAQILREHFTQSPEEGTPEESYSFYGKGGLISVTFSFEEETFSKAERLSSLKEALPLEGIYGGISRVHPSLYDLKEAYREADSAHRYAVYLERSDLVRFEQVEYTSVIPQEVRKHYDSMEFEFKLGHIDQVREQVQAYLRYLKEMDLMPELFTLKGQELLFLLERLLMDANLPVSIASLPDPETLKTGDGIEAWVLTRAMRLLDAAEDNAKEGSDLVIRRVKGYIRDHYGEGLSLEEMAELAHMSPNYLSVLFKKETGETYVRYLKRVRMEKAMEFLREGFKAIEVCEKVGYHDYKYFSSQFKSTTGYSPDEYRRTL